MHVANLANRALAREDWARERLAAHAGRKLRIAAGPAALTLAINADGSFADTVEAPDLTLTIPPLRWPALMARPERWNELVVAAGDAGLASTIGELAQTLPWFIERSFARLFGPIVGAQMAEAGRRLLALPGYAAERVGSNFASYAGDESGLVTGARAGSQFAAEVAALSARVDALTERIDRLAKPVPAKRR
jgi:ubiquinone biosynthesis accessory factor UbiJ